MDKLFFQTSLPRAGSTLLQNIIGQNPDFYVTPTSGVLELLYSTRYNFTNSPEFKAQDAQLMQTGYKSFLKNGLEGFYNGITDKKYVLDKSRGWGVHYNFVNEFYPNPKMIIMVRDLRSIFASMEKKFRQNQLLDSGIVNHSEMVGTSIGKRVDIWGNSQPVGLAIERLVSIINEGNADKMLIIRFEDLVEYKQQVLDDIYQYLELPRYEHDFDNVEQITVEDDSVYGIYGDHKIQKEVKFINPKFNEILTTGVSNYIYDKYRWFFDNFNYIK